MNFKNVKIHIAYVYLPINTDMQTVSKDMFRYLFINTQNIIQ